MAKYPIKNIVAEILDMGNGAVGGILALATAVAGMVGVAGIRHVGEGETAIYKKDGPKVTVTEPGYYYHSVLSKFPFVKFQPKDIPVVAEGKTLDGTQVQLDVKVHYSMPSTTTPEDYTRIDHLTQVGAARVLNDEISQLPASGLSSKTAMVAFASAVCGRMNAYMPTVDGFYTRTRGQVTECNITAGKK